MGFAGGGGAGGGGQSGSGGAGSSGGGGGGGRGGGSGASASTGGGQQASGGNATAGSRAGGQGQSGSGSSSGAASTASGSGASSSSSTVNTNGRVGSDGSFLIAGVSPNLYTVLVSGVPDGYYVSAIRVGSSDILAAGLNVDGSPITARVVLRSGAAQVSGLVLDPSTVQAAPRATVVLAPQEPERKETSFFYKTAVADASGQFTVRSVPPGSYSVYAWETVESGAYMDPDFIRMYERKGKSLIIREGGAETLQLNLIPGDSSLGAGQ